MIKFLLELSLKAAVQAWKLIFSKHSNGSEFKLPKGLFFHWHVSACVCVCVCLSFSSYMKSALFGGLALNYLLKLFMY